MTAPEPPAPAPAPEPPTPRPTTPALEIETVVAAPPAEVFRYFVEPERHVRWQGLRAELDPRPGGRYWVELEQATAEGVYLIVEPPHRVSFSWGFVGHPSLPPGTSTVEVTLEPDGDGTRLRLRHNGLPDERVRGAHDEGWHDHLGVLAKVVGQPG
jgi:uncharacterized protein YndB with AHSA1/START domain